MRLGLGLGSKPSRALPILPPIEFTFTATAADMDFGGKLSTQAGESVLVDYGDGNTEIVTGAEQQLDHIYAVEQAYTIKIFNPARLTKLDFGYYGNHNAFQYNLSGDISSVQYGVNLIYLYLNYTSVSGDISAVSGLINLTVLRLNNTLVSDYTAGTLGFTVVNINIRLDDLTGLDATEISNLLIDLDALGTAWTTPQIDFTGCGENYAGLDAGGQTAYDSLVVKGWTVSGL